MDAYWLAIDRKTTSYEELKYRRVVAQGFPGVGDVYSLLPLVHSGIPTSKNAFIRAIQAMEDPRYSYPAWGHSVLWRMLSIKAGDVVVGIEGTIVRGMCQLTTDATQSYRCEPDLAAYEYNHTAGFPLTWVDWDEALFGFTPSAPRQSVDGVRRLRNDRDRVLQTWATWGRKHDWRNDGALY